MITSFIFLGSALVLLGIYLYFIKHADIEIAFINGVNVGVTLTSPELDNVKTHYLDIWLGVIIVSFIWDEEC